MARKIVQELNSLHHARVLLLFFCSGILSEAKSHSEGPVTRREELTVIKDSVSANRLNGLSKQYWSKNLDSSVYYAQKALEISQKLQYKKGIAESFRNIGVTNTFMGDKNVAREYLLKALILFSTLPDKKDVAATYNNLGVVYSDLSEFTTSLKYFDSALTLFRKSANKEGEGSVLNYIGINYQQQGNYQKAIDYCLQGFEIRKQINDHPGVVFSLINVGNMYLNAGQPQTALNFYDQSVIYAREHNMEPFDYSIRQIGKTYLRLKQYDKAEGYLVRVINGKVIVSDHLTTGELYTETNRLDGAIRKFNTSLTETPETNKAIKALSFIGLSKVYLKKGKQNLAMSYVKEAYDIADVLQNKLILAEVAGVLARLYKINEEYNKALHYFELAHSITDSVSGENYQRKLAFTESKNEIEKEKSNVQLLSAERKLQQQKLNDEQFLKKVILIVFAAAVIFAMIIIKNINTKRKKIQFQKDQIALQNARMEHAYENLKSTQAQLIQREKMASLGELTAGIAHEIQNPLNFVNNFSEVNKELLIELKNEIAKGNIAGLGDIANDIIANEEKINHHGKRADGIVKGMLQHSRSSAGSKEPININALADEYLRLAYHGLRAKDANFKVILKTDFDVNIGNINMVSQDIGRVLLNLYSNAFYSVMKKKKTLHDAGIGIDYEPTIMVSTKALKSLVANGGRGILITIKDNGTGIPEKISEKIYQPFFTTKPAGQGTGLGLSLSYDIIKAHGGEIKMQTEAGEFAEFMIELPVV